MELDKAAVSNAQSDTNRRKIIGNKQEKRFDTSKPHFRKPKANDTKIELDDRFKTVLTDPRFQLQAVDRYGRKTPKSKTKSVNSEYNNFYTIKDEKKNVGNDDIAGRSHKAVISDDRFKVEDEKIDRTSFKSKDSNVSGEDNESNDMDPATRIAYLTALSRGEIDISSSDDDEDVCSIKENSDDSDDDDDDPISCIKKESPGILDPSFNENTTAVDNWTTVESPFLAVMNADWSHFRAVDIYAIISSFVPAGTVLRVTVYPSNFGLERLQKEELFGPIDVWKSDKQSQNIAGNHRHDEDSVDHDDAICDDDENIAYTTDPVDTTDGINSDFDPEKLRLYEASRLKYYFAVVEFSDTQYADMAYREVDGMEFEHSSAALDLRIIPVDEVSSVIEDRKIRDQASSVPSKYIPPDYVVSALQQSTVQCTWDVGDQNRESFLTKYTDPGQKWGQISEADDLKAYLASDQSSDDDDSTTGIKKSRRLRGVLGLDSDSDSNGTATINPSSRIKSALADSDGIDSDTEQSITATYVPGKPIVQTTSDEMQDTELTPWEKYLSKRQQKRREKRAATRERRKQVNEIRKKGVSSSHEATVHDDFFVEQKRGDLSATTFNDQSMSEDENNRSEPKNVGSIDDLDKRDFDIRAVQRIEKNKDKKLKGTRKRKEERLAGNVIGKEFHIDTTDERFNAVLKGNDARFGIDRTDPNYKETPSMKEILLQQKNHRLKRTKVNAHENNPTPESAALNSLVTIIKSKVHG